MHRKRSSKIQTKKEGGIKTETEKVVYSYMKIY